MNVMTGDGGVPAALLARLVRDVWDPLEVKLVLLVASMGGERSPVAESDVLTDDALAHGLRADGSNRDLHERCLEAMEIASARGVLIRLVAQDGSRWVVLGTDANRRRARSGLTAVPSAAGDSLVLRPERPNVFALYEQNIGLVTPIVADRLVEALERYPESWIEEAIGEAVGYNKRSWRYVQRILENWATEGRSDETNRGSASRDLDRDKHIRGKYAPIFRRE